MDAFVKLKGIDAAIPVQDIALIKSREGSGPTEIKDFQNMQFHSTAYYVFIGRSILHVYGRNIEYVYFQTNQ